MTAVWGNNPAGRLVYDSGGLMSAKDRLTLSTPPIFRAGRTSVYVLVWERES